MIRSIVFTQAGITHSRPAEEIPDALVRRMDFLWVDIVDEPDEICKTIFQDVFNFHLLAIDDAIHETHVPKVDDWGTYLSIVWRSARKASEGSFEILTPELDIFLGPNYLVTYHK